MPATYQFLSGLLQLVTPLDGAVVLVVADDLLLDAGRVLAPRGHLDQALRRTQGRDGHEDVDT